MIIGLPTMVECRDGDFASTRPNPTCLAPLRRGDGAVMGYINCPDTRGEAVTDFV